MDALDPIPPRLARGGGALTDALPARPPGLAPPCPGPCRSGHAAPILRPGRSYPEAARGRRPAPPVGPFAEVVPALIGPLVRVAGRILACEDLARDAVQEALVALWLRETFPANPRAWLTRAVVHRSLHLARSRSRRRKHEGLAGLARAGPSVRDDPARLLEVEELGRVVAAALAGLAPEFRLVLALHAREQLDYAAIAAALDIPVGTVRSRLNRARKALRAILRRTLADGPVGPESAA